MSCPLIKAATVFCLALIPLMVHAHIGDDITQLRQAYGATGQKTGSAMIYQHNGYSISVYFDGTHSAMEVFTRDGSIKNKTDITQDDIDQILDMEGDGHPWAQVTNHSGRPTWMRDDQRLIARLSPGELPGDKVFMVMVNRK